ncbi:MAG: S9 family peptidase [Candidatus Latescibacteria bacterium]|jgi:dipeptidyl aminopeptidase/acylaminoacyl peptidase|nr:S9 family peptidase [Candidatus Latescibacterota bacterium]
MATKQTAPFGYWESPFTPSSMGGQLRLSDVQWDSDGSGLVWLEGRSGRGVLVYKQGINASFDLNEEHNVRAGVGYGGGDFTVNDGKVVYAEKDGRLYCQSISSGEAVPITPGFGNAASPVISPDGQRVLYVHTYENKDVLAIASLYESSWPTIATEGADFYMQPAWHPHGDRITWIEWDQPNMPWDGTRLKYAQISQGGGGVTDERTVSGDAEIAVFQPTFSPDGRWLAYIETYEEWDRLVLECLETGDREVLVDRTTLAEPAWVQGIRVYGWMPDSNGLYFHRNDAGFGSLCRVEISSLKIQTIETGPYSWFQNISVSPAAQEVACIASSPAIPDRIISLTDTGQVIQRRSSSERVSPEEMSTPKPMSWDATDGTVIHGLYYPPANGRFECEGLPPAIIGIHGGPTSQRTANYSADAAFFTSRGYAFLDVNYRGSTGYGRPYMLALREQWGEFDTEDAAGAAQALMDQGLADPSRLVIKGGSAGGFTVLNALIHHPGLFRAGLSLFGVTNLFSLATDTHKFEAKYLDLLVGTLPDQGQRYQERSPIFHADRIRDPLAIFQGSDDQVVPPDQAESLVKTLQSAQVPHIYRLYEGEGHGWRKMETIIAFYEDVDRFLKEHVLV